jgi:hypothetical protein
MSRKPCTMHFLPRNEELRQKMVDLSLKSVFGIVVAVVVVIYKELFYKKYF